MPLGRSFAEPFEPESIRERAQRLLDLADDLAGLDVRVRSSYDWPHVGLALMQRARQTLEIVVTLLDRPAELDSAVLVRSLYEHVVVFAWLAIDPALHVDRWAASDDSRARAANQHWLDHIGISLFDDDMLRELEDRRSWLPAAMPDLRTCATQADDHWHVRADGVADRRQFGSLSGLYLLIYRTASELVHPTWASVNQLTDEQAGSPRIRHGPRVGRLWSGSAPLVFGTGLLIAGATLGTPDVRAVRRALGQISV